MSLTNVYNAPLLYAVGLEISKSDSLVINIAPGRARNSANNNDIVLSQATTIDFGRIGVGGLDIGSIQASKTYAVYLIADSTEYKQPSVIASLNQTTPILPPGYDIYMRIGFVLSKNTSTIGEQFVMGAAMNRAVFYNIEHNVLTAGNDLTYTAVNLNPFVPLIDCEVFLTAEYTANSVINFAEFITGGATSSSRIFELSGGVTNTITAELVLPARVVGNNVQIQYKVTEATDALNLSVAGYRDNLQYGL